MSTEKKNTVPRAVKCPTKRTVNLAKHESRRQNILTLVLGTLVILLVCFAVAKFGVIDQFARLSEAEMEYNRVHDQLTVMNTSLENYSEVEQEYHTYSRKWMTEEEGVGVSVDRMDVLDLMQQQMMSCGTVKTFSVEDDIVLVTMADMNLEQISTMLASLQRQPIVKSTSLTIASTTRVEANSIAANILGAEVGDYGLEFSVTITLQPEAEEEEAE